MGKDREPFWGGGGGTPGWRPSWRPGPVHRPPRLVPPRAGSFSLSPSWTPRGDLTRSQPASTPGTQSAPFISTRSSGSSALSRGGGGQRRALFQVVWSGTPGSVGWPEVGGNSSGTAPSGARVTQLHGPDFQSSSPEWKQACLDQLEKLNERGPPPGSPWCAHRPWDAGITAGGSDKGTGEAPTSPGGPVLLEC